MKKHTANNRKNHFSAAINLMKSYKINTELVLLVPVEGNIQTITNVQQFHTVFSIQKFGEKTNNDLAKKDPELWSALALVGCALCTIPNINVWELWDIFVQCLHMSQLIDKFEYYWYSFNKFVMHSDTTHNSISVEHLLRFDIDNPKYHDRLYRKHIVLNLPQFLSWIDMSVDSVGNCGLIATMTANRAATTSINLMKELLELIDIEKHPDQYLLPEDDWYPSSKSSKPIKPTEPTFDDVLENDGSCNFSAFNDEPSAEVVQEFENKEKLVKLIKRGGGVRYIVIGEDVDVSRLPKIFTLMMKEELHIVHNPTINRVTRLIKVDALLSSGWSVPNIAKKLEISPSLAYADVRILKDSIYDALTD